MDDIKRTYWEYCGEGHSVKIVHCEGCGIYLGVNYPSDWCGECWRKGKPAEVHTARTKADLQVWTVEKLRRVLRREYGHRECDLSTTKDELIDVLWADLQASGRVSNN